MELPELWGDMGVEGMGRLRRKQYSIDLSSAELIPVNGHETSLCSQEKVLYSVAVTCPRAILGSARGKMASQKMI